MSVEDLKLNIPDYKALAKPMLVLSEEEKAVGQWIDGAYFKIVIGTIVFLMILFLALKAGFSLWLMQKLNIGERLVNDRGEPDFWNISRTLETYQRPVAAPQQTVQQEKREMFGSYREHLDPRILAAL